MKATSRIMILSCFLFVGFSLTNAAPQLKKDEDNAQSKQITLSSIYSTSGQNGLVPILAKDLEFSKQLQEIYSRAITNGSSNFFLARGDNIKSAVLATWTVFSGSGSVDRPVRAESDSKSTRYWAVAFLGVRGSEPPEWTIRDIEVDGFTVKLSFEKEGAKTKDLAPYFYWIPLGELPAGVFSLVLYDRNERRANLIRTITVP